MCVGALGGVRNIFYFIEGAWQKIIEKLCCRVKIFMDIFFGIVYQLCCSFGWRKNSWNKQIIPNSLEYNF